MNPLVSVVIPTYNRPLEVRAAVASVLQQSYRPLEIIVVDDHSTEELFEAMREAVRGTVREALRTAAGDEVPVCFERLPCNRGPSGARNAGIRKAHGKYIAFLDSDDAWLPSKLQAQIDILERAPAQQPLVVYAQVWIRRKGETIVRPRRAIATGEPLADYLFAASGYVAQSTLVLAASLARKVLYDESLRLHEDWDFFLRLQAQGASFQMVPEPLAIYADDAGDGRASAAQPLRSLAFLERWKPDISERAYLALRAKVAPQMRGTNTAQALRFIAQAVLRRAIHPVYSLALVGRLMFPGLRDAAYALRGRLPGAARLPSDLPNR
jgi:glycosyltransferase involved in cell wall biosynthesis